MQDGLDDPAGFAENVVAPKPDHCPALPFQKSGSARVHRIVGMLTAIDLDHQQYSVQAKSTMKPPTGCCLRNLYLNKRRSRSADHMRRSASVEDRRSRRAF
jgi:hypothetical protein